MQIGGGIIKQLVEVDIMYVFLFLLILYSVYVLLMKPSERTLTNVLLLTIAVGVDVVVHRLREIK